MKEKFEASKKKQLLIAATALAAGFVVIVLGSSLLSGDAQREKEKKMLELPTVKYIDSDKVEKDSFKETYGKQLTSMQQKQTQTDKQLQELIKVLDEKNKKEAIEQEEKRKNANNGSSNPILNGLVENIPPLENIEKEVSEAKEEEMSKMEVKVEDSLLIIDNGVSSVDSEDKLNLPSNQKPENSSTATKKKKKINIPAGSFVKVTLLNGLDAPAGTNAKQEPHPVVLRITGIANLPNKYKSDIKECRAIAGGYGELSSERAMIRVESLSCIGNDGTKYESQSDTIGFLTGEDGKIGLAGRVVTKQGAILGRTLLAGFVEGLGEVFKESSSTVNTTGVGVTSTIDPNKAGQVGLYSGIGKGAEKLSEYYLKLNDQMFPIVEINVGRDADMLFNKTVTLEEVIKEEE
ncbi:TraB/VirB10 family protein [Aliarcobacter butzleri]|jgi:conjugal transfer pilus assembly protein TraB|uniref:TraB/VirB10 family protein n=1 Tax=Aliarcobacter butzleri TaxID=28197 RepID=UPI0021B3C96E|nr:TraB/VirB10 family protein [Aliarcobacter butzleri]UXC30520.1 TraB/VirB10 family protein [Aliarcobacter butzleri]